MKRKNLLLLLCLITGITVNAQTWDGSAGTDWNTPANWSTNAVPTANDNVTIPGSLTNYPVLSGDVSISTINMQAGSQLDFNGFVLNITSNTSAFKYFTGATLLNSNAATDIVINLNTGISGYHTYVRSSVVNDNITINISGENNLFEADASNTGNQFSGNVTYNFNSEGDLYFSNGDTSMYNGNFTITRTTKGISQGFNSGGIIGGNFSYSNNTSGDNDFGITTKTTSVAGMVNITITDTATTTPPGIFELHRLVNQTTGGVINAQNTRGFSVENDTLKLTSVSITGYRGTVFATLYNNDITGNVTTASSSAQGSGYHTYLRSNIINGNAAFTINSSDNLYEADASNSGNEYSGDVSFNMNSAGGLYFSNGDTSTYADDLTVTRTGKGTTQGFNSGGIVGGNFTYSNNTSGDNDFGITTKTTSVAGMVNITITDTATTTTPGVFDLHRLLNQTAGGVINVQNTRGFSVENDTLKLTSMSITGYRGTVFATLYNNDITGNVTTASSSAQGSGYHTYLRSNIINGNAAFTINSSDNLYEADASNSGNEYSGDVSFNMNSAGGLYFSNGDTSTYAGNLTVTRTGKGTTQGFNSGGIVGGNFSYSNNTSGNNDFGTTTKTTSIGGMVNITITDTATTTTPGIFELHRVINQTTGGVINVQNTRGFSVENDTLKLASMSITGYKSAAYGTLYNNDITGDITTASHSTGIGYHTYIRSNIINGNASFTMNSSDNLYESNGSGNSDIYHGNASFTNTGTGIIYIANGDTSYFGGNLTLNSSASGINIEAISFIDNADGVFEQMGTQPLSLPVLVMNKTGGGKLTLNDPVTITSKLTFIGGNMENNPTNKLIFLDGDTHEGASAASHVVGYVEKTGNEAFEFPLGDTTSYNPVSMTAPGNATDVFGAQYLSKNPDTDGYDTSMHVASLQRISGAEYWIIQRLNGSSNVTLTFTYTDHNPTGDDEYITDPSKVHIARWTGSIWEDLGNGGYTGTTSGTITTAGPVTNFSPFTFGSTDIVANPLPLQLLSFTALQDESNILLKWKTANEINLSHFEVERSGDGIQFTKIGTVAADNADYGYRDISPANGTNFYRLKMVDKDGKSGYSDIISFSFNVSNRVVIYPNPATDVIHILSAKKIKLIEVASLSGNIVQRMMPNANNQYDISHLQAGVYLVKIQDEEKITVSKLVVR